MVMNSMTGFGSGQARDERLTLVVEAASLNARTLEVTCSGPREWLGLEPAFYAAVREQFERGRIKIGVYVDPLAKGKSVFSCDKEAVKAALEKLKSLSQSLGAPFDVDASLLFKIAMSSSQKEPLPYWEQVQPLAKAALQQAIDGLKAMRRREGAVLAGDVRERIQRLLGYLHTIRRETSKIVPAYRDRLWQRLKQLGLSIDFDDERFLKEITFFADRCDFSEEIIRLESHFKQMEAALRKGGPMGRKLNFLIQEMLREINTLGSKAHSASITRDVMEFKNELERMREQVQNVE